MRCGACLSIFAATENLLEQDEELLDESESVFVASNPDEFFNPSTFLTRQALQDALRASEQEQATSEDANAAQDADDLTSSIATSAPPISSDEPAEIAAEQSDVETVPAEEQAFFAAVEASLQQTADESADQPVASSENAELVVDDSANESEPATEETSTDRHDAADEVDAAGEHADFQVATPEQDSGSDKSVESTQASAFNAALDEAVAESRDDPAEDSSGGAPENTPVDSHADSVDIAADPVTDPAIDQPFDQPIDPPSDSAAADQQSSRSQPSPYSPYSPHLPPREFDDHSPEAFRLHASFSVETAPYSAAPAEPEQDTETTAVESSQHDDDSAFNDALNAGFEDETATQVDLIAASDDAALAESLQSADDLDWTLSEDAAEQSDAESSDLPDEAVSQEAEESFADTEEEAEEEITADEASEPADVDQSVAAIRARALQNELKDDEALEQIPQENLMALGKFSSPVEILAGQPRSLRRQITWTVLALFAGIGLATQYLWREMDRYSQNNTLRPAYEFACQWLDCDLPVYTDLQAISATSLAVRSHPEVNNALRVNIEFQNFAPFEQRFPILVLSFNSADNSVVALREFAAADYLPQQLRGRSLMPAQTPLQVNLDIIDPGDDAVNYTLAFRNP